MGYGNAQCGPGPNRILSPCPRGLPKRRITAFSCGPTVKKPDPKNTTTRMIIRILMIAKLLRSASDSACELESSGTSGGGGGSGVFVRRVGVNLISSVVI